MLQQNIKQQEIFNQNYSKLNPQQKLAVDTLEGPVMVNAGPGTGKTQILATRIGNILLNTDTDPSNILCLTYTDNGAVEMRRRLLKIVGTAAYNISIHTYHSFCNEVIQDNKSFFGIYELEAISDLEHAELFRTLIDNIDKDNPLKRFSGEVYYDQARLKNLFALMKKEAFTPEYLNVRIDEYLKELPTKEGFYYKVKYKGASAGDPKPQKIADETEKMEKLRAAINLYSTYNLLLKEHHRYTFDDMILWVLDAFEKNKDLLLNYQERYLYFLIDEFQDTSRAQNLITQYLTSYWDNPNVFVVGDADQSIFSFQDANVENIIDFEKKYATALAKIDLINNYRSTQNILNAAYSLITNNKLRTVDPENNTPLTAANKDIADLNISPSVTEYPNPFHEAVDISLQIENLIANKVNGKDIAVIYKNHKHVDSLATILQQKNIPINLRKSENVLEIPLIQNLIHILNWINQENTIPYSGDDLLFKILHFNFFNTTPIVVAKLGVQLNENKFKRKDGKISLRSLLADLKLEAGDLFSVADNSLKSASIILEDLILQSNNNTIQRLLELTIQKTGILKYVLGQIDKAFLMQALNGFFNFLKESCSKNKDLSLHEFIEMISLMHKDNISIPITRIISNENGVNLITAHSSKGSEYQYVFIINATNDAWDKNGRKNQEFTLPDNLIINKIDTTNDIEEKRRLFYVAATRAKTHLHISFTTKNEKEKDATPSQFIAEISEAQDLSIAHKSVADEQLIEYKILEFSENQLPKMEIVEAAYINEILKKYSLSVTHLNNYLQCPLKFYYVNLIKVPSAKSESLTFGSAIHYSLEFFFKKMKDNGYQFPSQDELINSFDWFMKKNRENFTPEEFQRKMEYGNKILPAYYQSHIDQWHKNVIIEHNIRDIQIAGIPINGKIDKIEIDGNNATVVDYKTGKHENAKKKLSPPSDKEPNGGDYWRQAVFYKILMDYNTKTNWNTNKVVFDFIEPVKDEYKAEEVVISNTDMTTVTQQIKMVWGKIQNHEFHTGCGKLDCEWCSFVKTNKLYSELIDAEDGINEDEV